MDPCASATGVGRGRGKEREGWSWIQSCTHTHTVYDQMPFMSFQNEVVWTTVDVHSHTMQQQAAQYEQCLTDYLLRLSSACWNDAGSML